MPSLPSWKWGEAAPSPVRLRCGVQSGLEERPASPNLLPTGNSSTLANVVLADRGTAPSPSLPTLAQAQLPDFPGSDWLAAMSAMEACQSTLTALPPAQAPMGFSYQVGGQNRAMTGRSAISWDHEYSNDRRLIQR